MLVTSLIVMMLFLSGQPVLAESSAQTTPSTTSTESSPQRYVIITGSSVNIRSDAGTSFAKIGTAKKGKSFVYLSSKKGTDSKIWHQIQYSTSTTAWVISSYSRFEMEPSQNRETPSEKKNENNPDQKYVIITGNNVNLRSEPDTSFAKIGTVQKGAKFDYLSSRKGTNGKVWYQVQYSSTKTAWVISSYSKIEQKPSKQYVVITGSEVNLRSDAGSSFGKVGKAKKESKFVYLSSKAAKDNKDLVSGSIHILQEGLGYQYLCQTFQHRRTILTLSDSYNQNKKRQQVCLF